MGIAGFWEWGWEGENSATKSWRRLIGTCARNVRISDISENEVEIWSRKVRILYKFASEVRIWAFLWRFGGSRPRYISAMRVPFSARTFATVGYGARILRWIVRISIRFENVVELLSRKVRILYKGASEVGKGLTEGGAPWGGRVQVSW